MPSESTIIGWTEHNAHADGAAPETADERRFTVDWERTETFRHTFTAAELAAVFGVPVDELPDDIGDLDTGETEQILAEMEQLDDPRGAYVGCTDRTATWTMSGAVR